MTALLNHLWQSSIFLVGVWLLARALGRHRAAVRHALWLVGSLKFLVPFEALFVLGRQFGAGLPGATSLPLAQLIEVTSDPFSHPAVTAAATAVARGAAVLVWSPDVALTAIWSLGFLWALSRWAVEWSRTARLIRHHRVTADPVVTDLRTRIDLLRPFPQLELAVCNGRIEPGIFGVWRPVFIWPRALSARLSDSEVDAVVAHELCHVRRHDNLTAALHNLVSAAFWFYPLVGWIGRRLHHERERACDEEVVRTGVSPRTYAESIVKACEFCTPTHALAATGATGNLRRRVLDIIHGQTGDLLSTIQRVALAASAASAVLIPISFGAASAPHLRAQEPATAGGSPVFEVASVKPNHDLSGARLFQALPGGRVTLVNLTLRELIVGAYQTQDHLIVGGPAWLGTEHFDVVARAADGASPREMLPMMRTLLADHFKLVMHREQREMPVYNLMASRDAQMPGARLQPTTCVTVAPGDPPVDGRDDQGQFQCGINRFGPGQILLTGNTLDALANRLGSVPAVGRSVINRSGFEGRYDIELSFAPGIPDQTSGAVSLFTALDEQLGLRLAPARERVEVLVVDSVKQPTED